jgi:predicted nuclease with TOPRIM domain
MASEKKPPKGAISVTHTPDGLDLLKIEQRIEVLEKKKADLERKSKLVPGRSEQLARVSQELSQLRHDHSSMQEHVRANLYQSKIYENEKALAQRDAARQQMLDEKKEVAAQGRANYREALRTYVASWKKKSKVTSGTAKDNDQGNEPE